MQDWHPEHANRDPELLLPQERTRIDRNANTNNRSLTMSHKHIRNVLAAVALASLFLCESAANGQLFRNGGGRNESRQGQVGQSRSQPYPGVPDELPPPAPDTSSVVPAAHLAEGTNMLPQVKTKLKPNEITLVPKPLGDTEIEKITEHMDEHVESVVTELRTALAEAFVDPSELLASLTKAGADADAQSRLLQAVKQGDPVFTQILWTQITKDADGGKQLYERVENQQRFEKMADKALSDSLTTTELRSVRMRLLKRKLSSEQAAAAQASFKQLEDLVKIRTALQSKPAVAGGLPSPSVTEKSLVILCPNLARSTLWSLGNGYMAVGTGGQGHFAMENCSPLEALQWPFGDETSLAEVATAAPQAGVLLLNPDSTESAITYTISGHNYTMQPGHTQSLPADRAWVIEFDRGGSWGKQRYTLSNGSYNFLPSEKGWELIAKKYQCTIDNSANPNPFHCLINGKPVTIEPLGSKLCQGTYPIVVQFDRGNGASKQIQLTEGNCRPAINRADSGWDLFPVEAGSEIGVATSQ
jgi:hypothetical protein